MVNAILHHDKSPAVELIADWHGSATRSETTLHQLSPYIGKTKSSMAASLISQFTKVGDTIYDPFSGSGTVALEAWIARRFPIANDLNPYAHLLTTAKLFPYSGLEEALLDLASASKQVQRSIKRVDLRTIPCWVRSFFSPETLREIVAWVAVLRKSQNDFLLACLLGILHHQRPGFLSYPSSHSVPYLRSKSYPAADYPELYDYRELYSRLEAKIRRALHRLPQLDFDIERFCYSRDAAGLTTSAQVDAIITSPPYMRSLDYGRDNRLRLWFLGSTDWRTLDTKVSPRERTFISLMRRCLELWKTILADKGHCVIIAGDRFSPIYDAVIPDVIARIATEEVGGYELVGKYTERIPEMRRVRRRHAGNSKETILILRLNKGVRAWQNN